MSNPNPSDYKEVKPDQDLITAMELIEHSLATIERVYQNINQFHFFASIGQLHGAAAANMDASYDKSQLAENPRLDTAFRDVFLVNFNKTYAEGRKEIAERIDVLRSADDQLQNVCDSHSSKKA